MPRPRGAGGWQAVPGRAGSRPRTQADEESVSSRSTASPTPSRSPTPESIRAIMSNSVVSEDDEDDATIIREKTDSLNGAAIRASGSPQETTRRGVSPVIPLEFEDDNYGPQRASQTPLRPLLSTGKVPSAHMRSRCSSVRPKVGEPTSIADGPQKVLSSSSKPLYKRSRGVNKKSLFKGKKVEQQTIAS